MLSTLNQLDTFDPKDRISAQFQANNEVGICWRPEEAVEISDLRQYNLTPVIESTDTRNFIVGAITNVGANVGIKFNIDLMFAAVPKGSRIITPMATMSKDDRVPNMVLKKINTEYQSWCFAGQQARAERNKIRQASLR
jgi:hypothetical protein